MLFGFYANYFDGLLLSWNHCGVLAFHWPRNVELRSRDSHTSIEWFAERVWFVQTLARAKSPPHSSKGIIRTLPCIGSCSIGLVIRRRLVAGVEQIRRGVQQEQRRREHVRREGRLPRGETKES